jgi:hypothetical protein
MRSFSTFLRQRCKVATTWLIATCAFMQLVTPGRAAGAVEASVDLDARNATVAGVVDMLRRDHCAAVSFIEAREKQSVTMTLRHVSVLAVLAEISARIPAYRFEVINGRAVLYPSTAEYQTIVSGVNITKVRRFDAADRFIAHLRRTTPPFAGLALPSRGYLTLGPSPFFDEPVSLRKEGRVIDQFVDLLGHGSRVYFEITKAPTGVPAFGFGQVMCAPVVAPVHISSCAEAGELASSDGDLREGGRVSLDIDNEPWPIAVRHLQSAEHVPVSFIEDSSARRVTMHARDLPPRMLLDKFVSAVPGLRCLSANGHLVILPSTDALQTRLDNVHITMTTPWHSASSLAELLRVTPAFRDLSAWVEPPSDPELLNVEVSLAGHGSALDLLVQLLDDNPRAYFMIEKLPSGKRALGLASVVEASLAP